MDVTNIGREEGKVIMRTFTCKVCCWSLVSGFYISLSLFIYLSISNPSNLQWAHYYFKATEIIVFNLICPDLKAVC